MYVYDLKAIKSNNKYATTAKIFEIVFILEGFLGVISLHCFTLGGVLGSFFLMSFDFKTEYVNAILILGKSCGAGAGVSVGIVFESLVFALSRNPSEQARLFKFSMLVFAFTVTEGLLAQMMAFLLLFSFCRNIFATMQKKQLWTNYTPDAVKKTNRITYYFFASKNNLLWCTLPKLPSIFFSTINHHYALNESPSVQLINTAHLNPRGTIPLAMNMHYLGLRTFTSLLNNAAVFTEHNFKMPYKNKFLRQIRRQANWFGRLAKKAGELRKANVLAGLFIFLILLSIMAITASAKSSLASINTLRPMPFSYVLLRSHLVLRSEVVLKTQKRFMISFMESRSRMLVHTILQRHNPVYIVQRSNYTAFFTAKPEEIKINKEPMEVFVSATETRTVDPKTQEALEKFNKKHPKIISDAELKNPESFRGLWLCITHKVPTEKLQKQFDFKVLDWIQIANDPYGKVQYLVSLNRKMTLKELNTMPRNYELTTYLNSDPKFIPSVDSLIKKTENILNQTVETGAKDSMQQLKHNAKNNNHDKYNNDNN